jgi:alanine-synthesizing transaminase
VAARLYGSLLRMFSSRLPARLAPNAWSAALATARCTGRALFDLTETNPTTVGIPYPSDVVSSLADTDGLTYRPDARGIPTAREAVARMYRDRGFAVSAETVVLTASTSEAYATLFKLLCDPGDAVLVPQPSYPLFDLLLRLEGVRPVPYRLEYHGRWSIDRTSVEAAMSPACRAVLVVSPNNPTGSFLRADDREWLVMLCAARGLALVIDEVFAEYALLAGADMATVVVEPRVLTFSLGGLSKSAGLPQMKLAWTVVSGPQSDVADALARLDVIADTYLTVSTAVQLAAGRLLSTGAAVREAIATRVMTNLSSLRAAVHACPAVTLLEPEGGWSAVLRIPAVESEEALVLRALRDRDVVVHPGYFFDFEDEAYLVLSLLPDPQSFDTGVNRLLDIFGEAAA